MVDVFSGANRRTRRFGYRNRRNYSRLTGSLVDDDEYDNYLNYENYTNYSALDYLKASLRRHKALKKCKKFLSRKKNSFILKNSNVMFVYDNKKKTIVCLNAKNISQTATVEWNNTANSIQDNNPNNDLEQTFDDICVSFNEKSSYDGIVKVLRSIFNNVYETQPQEEKRSNVIKHETKIEIPERNDRININDTTVEILAKQPGINIVIAKKIIRRINAKGNYFSLDEMFREMKIKNHFQLQLRRLLCAKPAESKPKKTKDNTDRIIDF